MRTNTRKFMLNGKSKIFHLYVRRKTKTEAIRSRNALRKSNINARIVKKKRTYDVYMYGD